MSFILGLTGPTGAGKGVFSECAKEFGFNVVDCDAVARQAVGKGTPALRALAEAFGQDIIAENGELNRKKLASIAFSSKEKTELLNNTVLPHIRKLVEGQISGDLVLLDAPTLFESGIDEICDKTVAVLAPKELRKDRIVRRDRLEAVDANIRINAGKPDKFYADRVDYLIINDGDLQNFIKKVKIHLSDIIGGNNDE